MKNLICRRVLALVLSAVMCITFYGCSSSEQKTSDIPSTMAATDSTDTSAAAETSSTTDTAAAAQPEADSEIYEAINQMTLEQKLSQMMIVALRSDSANTKTATEINQDYADLIQKYDFGGIILFTGNIADTAQTVRMIHDIQETSMKSDNGIPMFLCVDQEGGLVNRVSFGTTCSGNMALAAAGDLSMTEESAKIMGDEISSLGFNMDFAPAPATLTFMGIPLHKI